jgi:putative NADH-flavin reductase
MRTFANFEVIVMKIVLYGASGMIGSRILTEALARHHEVVAVVRNPEKIAAQPHLTVVSGDATDAASIAATAAGADLAISAYSPGNDNALLTKNAYALLEGIAQAGVPRLIVVGGAGSLEVAPGQLLVDSPTFPAMYRARATEQAKALDIFRASDGSSVTWTFISPPALIAPGTRTGTFRVGKDSLLVDADGKSHISAEDYAIALLDEAESPKHPNGRFTVGY